MSDLERWYRRLLRAYPARYRADRGDEIIGTLLEAAPADRERPRLREAAALVAGGAQARAAQNQRLSAPANLRLAAILGVAIFLGFAETGRAAIAASSPLSILPTSERLNGTPGHPVVAAALALTAITLIWFSPRYVAAPALGLAAAVSLQPLRPPGIALAIVLALLALLAAVSRHRPPRSWLWWLAVLPAWAVLGVLGPAPMLASALPSRRCPLSSWRPPCSGSWSTAGLPWPVR